MTGGWAIFRLLVKQWVRSGMAAGDIFQEARYRHPTHHVMAQLLILSNAGLVRARREGRSIIYCVDFGRMGALLVFLTKDCCGGRPEIGAPLAATVNDCCPPRKTRRA